MAYGTSRRVVMAYGTGRRVVMSYGTGRRVVMAYGTGRRAVMADGTGRRAVMAYGTGRRVVMAYGTGRRVVMADGTGRRVVMADGTGRRVVMAYGTGWAASCVPLPSSCTTDLSGLTVYVLNGLTREMSTPTIHSCEGQRQKGSPYLITECRVPELIPVLGSQPAGDVSHKPGGRLPLLSARPAVTLATLKRAATNFAAW